MKFPDLEKKIKFPDISLTRMNPVLARLYESTGRAIAVTTASASALLKMLDVFGYARFSNKYFDVHTHCNYDAQSSKLTHCN